jgi:hypothetical protein
MMGVELYAAQICCTSLIKAWLVRARCSLIAIEMA